LGHPTVVFFEMVGGVAVAEDVDKDEAFGGEPGRDFFEEERVGFHVLKHLDRHDVGESGISLAQAVKM